MFNPALLLQRVDALARERNLDREVIFDHLEQAIQKAARKRFDATGDLSVTIDRHTGEIRAFEDDRPVELESLGRIVADITKSVFLQNLRKSECQRVYEELAPRLHTIVSGTVVREEHGRAIVSIGGRAEAQLPRDEQLPGETYRPGAVIRAFVLKCERRKETRLHIVLSRTHPDFVRELFRAEIPEIADGLIEIKGIVREPGKRTKIAVASRDPRIEPVGSCVGVRGGRISKITDELGGEKIDIIPWSDDPAQFIENSLKPARILRISYDHFRDRAHVVVSQDQLPLAIGKGGQNVRLAARLTRYRIDVVSEEEQTEQRRKGEQELQPLLDAGLIDDFMRERFLDNHLDELAVLAAQTPEQLLEGLDGAIDVELATRLIAKANELLTPEQQAARDALNARRREDAERRAREEQMEIMHEAAHNAARAALPPDS
ncbi:MAG: transcription termination factor NusA [Planctomycetota bacterium]|nr:transcription termination factor NusA [Planctomycetota bacterium]MCX8040091.1 transcription termination factor NusA [Planctomycetota bacterium]MDW8372874.1 transcription termination factor NusA [Planctomycetota bacterium]